VNREQAKVELREDEGFRSVVYSCSQGHRTIGYGHMNDGMPVGLTMTQEEAETQLDEDLSIAIERAKIYVAPIEFETLTEGRQRALVNMSFQLGGNLFHFRKMHQAIIDDDWSRVADEAVDSQWFTQTQLRRKSRVVYQLKTGEE
jgi:lysozyme